MIRRIVYTRKIALVLALLAIASARAADEAMVGGFGPAQSVADAIKDFTGADGAFVPAALIKSDFQRDRLESILQYPTDEVVVVSLSGSQIRQAFERSLALYPAANSGFLQISGFEVTFKKTAPPNARIISISAGGSPLEDGRTYTVAMPGSLARGGLGYFKIWDKARIKKTYADTTLETVLRGKRASDSASRWQARS